MQSVGAALAAQQAELSALLEGLSDADWDRPVPTCPGWTVTDVVLHLAQTNEMAVDSAEGRYDGDLGGFASIDEGAAHLVAADRGAPGSAVGARWLASADRLAQAFQAGDPHARVTWVAGELALRTLATTRLAETWIHTGDVAGAVGVTLEPGDRLWHVARLAWRTLPYAFAHAGRQLAGPVAFELRGPNGDPWDFVPDTEPTTVVTGDGVELCLVAARRADPAATALGGRGPDVAAVLELVRTYA